MVARGIPLRETARRLCIEAEILSPSSFCSILEVDDNGALQTLAGPNLPPEFCRAFDGLSIGPSVGSCGTAAFLGRSIIVSDIEGDPLWEQFKNLALPLGLVACWSSPIFGSNGRVIGTFAFYFTTKRGPTQAEEAFVATCTDLCTIAFERHQSETIIHRLAYYDELTGLGNRANFLSSLSDHCHPEETGLLLIDVDKLKLVNDSLGHAAGDDLLREIGARIAAIAAPGSAYRLSGDEFAVIVRGSNISDLLPWVADNLIEAMRQPAMCCGHALEPAVTIGGAVFGKDTATIEGLRQKADLALYHAKETCRGGFVRFREGLGTAMAQRLEAIRRVQEAIEDGRLEAHFQPIVRLDTREIVGVEALCRVMDHDRVRMPEDQFQLAVTDANTAARITECMLAQVARAIRSWLDADIPFQHVGVNVAVGDFQIGALEQRIVEIFDRFGVPLEHLVLEVTELVYLGNSDLIVAESVKALRSRGLLVALDDFGTGYASLTHLLTLPVDIIKIDRSFVADLGPSGPSSIIIGGIIDIVRKLGMRVVAEGIETEQQAHQLQKLGCVLGQGYLYARSGDFATTTELLLAKAQRGPDAQSRRARGSRD